MDQLLILSFMTAYGIFLIRQATIFDAIRDPVFDYLKKDLQKVRSWRSFAWELIQCDLCIGFWLAVILTVLIAAPGHLAFAAPILSKIILNVVNLTSPK